ncbi:MAG: hypothetical protein JXB35_13810 [Anaerolineae bacterium]|nr:hypothetical protein [Anaerolineae bacterium]
MGKWLPRWGGHATAGLAARSIATFKPDVYHTVVANQRQVLGPDVDVAVVRMCAYHVFRNAARSYYELFHNVGRGRLLVSQFEPPVLITPESQQYLQQAVSSGRGVFILGCHTSNFDLSGIALCQYMPAPLQVLSLADPTAGFELFNRLRREAGAMVTPISPETLRQAMRRLKEGEAVITGVDRPIGEGDAPVQFFGAEAHLPTGYIRIPMRTRSLVMTAAPFYEEGAYRIHVNPPLEMVDTGDRDRDVQVNLRKVLSEVEDLIRRHPDQWMMFVPVWE